MISSGRPSPCDSSQSCSTASRCSALRMSRYCPPASRAAGAAGSCRSPGMEHGRQGSSNERSVKLTMTCFGVAALFEHVRSRIARVSPQRLDRADSRCAPQGSGATKSRALPSAPVVIPSPPPAIALARTRRITPTMQTVFGARLEQYASTARASPALAMPGREIAYSELLGRVRSCAAWLTREPGLPLQPVGITIAEEIPHLVASLTLLSLGVPQVSLPTSEPGSKRLNLAERLGVGRVLLTDPQYALPGRDAQLLTPDLDEPAAGHASLDAVLSDPDAPAIYFTSSGTSGEPKVFALSQRALAWRAELITAS